MESEEARSGAPAGPPPEVSGDRDDFAVVVAGGGPAGAAAALVLAGAAAACCWWTRLPPGTFRVGEALPPAAAPAAARPRRAGPLPGGRPPAVLRERLRLGVATSRDATDFLFNPHGHGWHLDRARFDAIAPRRPRREAGRGGAPRRRLAGRAETGGRRWRRRLHARTRIAARWRCAWLVDATGRRAAVARRQAAARLHDDRLVAFHARFRPLAGADDRDSRTLIEAAPDGWWYTALVPSGERVVACLTDADLADRAASCRPEGFPRGCGRRPHLRRRSSRAGYALAGRPPAAPTPGSARLDRFAGDGWLAVGDAALAFDPLSSQGILNALYTGLRGGQALARSLSRRRRRDRRVRDAAGPGLRNLPAQPPHLLRRGAALGRPCVLAAAHGGGALCRSNSSRSFRESLP